MKEEKRIYVVIPATVQPEKGRNVLQPYGRQIAQACHVVSKLRVLHPDPELVGFYPITTIILQCRDTAELMHVSARLVKKFKQMAHFRDDNPEYGYNKPITGVAVMAEPTKIADILGYLPLWGS